MRKAIILIIILLPTITFAQTEYRFTGQEYDSSFNTYYFNQRYYQPNIGKFNQIDPLQNYLVTPELQEKINKELEEVLANPQQLNNYSYVSGNPVRYTDPTGEFNWDTGEVEAGDSLSNIFGDRWQEVADYNNLDNPNIIYPAQILKIPWQDQNFLDKTVDWGTSIVPGASDVRDVTEFVYGRDLVTGEEVSYTERAEMGALAVLPFISGPITRKIKRIGQKLSNTLNNIIVNNKAVKKIFKTLGLNPQKIVDKLTLPKVLDDFADSLDSGSENLIKGLFR